jgi:hypothetical protein
VSINPFGDPAEQLAAQFHVWEKRGRGWDIYPFPVELEPPFRPFERFVRVPVAVDDGRRPGALRSLLTLGLAGRRQPQAEEGSPEPEPSPRPAATGPVTELHLLLPEGFEPRKEMAEALVQVCHSCTAPLGFELISRSGEIQLQLVCSPPDAPACTRQLASLAPEVAILEREEYLAVMWEAVAGVPLVADLGLAEEFMRSLREPHNFAVDPLVEVLNTLAGTERGEIAVIQALITPARRPWSTYIMAAVTDADGRPFFAHGAELVAEAKKKISGRLYACRLRIAAKGRDHRRVRQLVRGLAAAFAQFGNPPAGNALIPLDHGGLSADDQQANLIGRTAHRCGMLLNAAELSALIHLPRRETAHTGLERLRQRTKAAPQVPREPGGLLLGENAHRGRVQPVYLDHEQRSRHVYIIGGSGTGKSSLLLNLIQQDIEAGHGVAVLDPHGDLADAILGRVPANRIDDVVAIDPSDAEYPVGINVLAAHSETERTLLAADLVALFRRQSTSWGDQMNAVFANAILAFVESDEGGTLLELRRFLVEKEYRQAFLRTVTDPEIVYYWQHEFPLLRGNPQAPILTRLDAFLRPKLIRHMVGSREPSLDFRRLMDEQKILVVKLPQGALGEDNAYLLGSLIIAKLQQLALSRQDVAAADRPPFYLYLDEFQHVATPSMSTLLSGVRKYGLALTLAHQNLSQLPPELVDSVFANAGTRVCFRVGEQDARKLADGFTFFEARDLHNLDTGQAICRIGRAEADFNLSTYPVPEIDTAAAQERTRAVLAASHRQYAGVLEAVPAVPVLPPPALETIPVAAEPVQPASLPPAAVTPMPRAPARPRAAPVTAGRGGKQHQYLQALVRRLGQDRGFRATMEQSVLDGIGSVDVALERDGLKVACEIWVTTPLDNEIKNVQKCLAAGFHHVVAISSNEKSLTRLTAALTASVGEDDRARVHLVSPEQLPQLLDSFTAPATQVETVGGYKVRVQYSADSDPDKEARSRTLHGVVAKTLKRFGKG